MRLQLNRIWLCAVCALAALFLSKDFVTAQEGSPFEKEYADTSFSFREFDTRQCGIEISPDGKTVFLVDQKNNLLLIDAKTLRVKSRVADVVEHRGKSLRFSPTGRHLVVEGVFGDISILEYDRDSGELSTVAGLGKAGNAVAFARDEPLVCYMTLKRQLCLFNFETDEIYKKVDLSSFLSLIHI